MNLFSFIRHFKSEKGFIVRCKFINLNFFQCAQFLPLQRSLYLPRLECWNTPFSLFEEDVTICSETLNSCVKGKKPARKAKNMNHARLEWRTKMKSLRNVLISQQKEETCTWHWRSLCPREREKYFLPIRNESCFHSSLKVSVSSVFRISRV